MSFCDLPKLEIEPIKGQEKKRGEDLSLSLAFSQRLMSRQFVDWESIEARILCLIFLWVENKIMGWKYGLKYVLIFLCSPRTRFTELMSKKVAPNLPEPTWTDSEIELLLEEVKAFASENIYNGIDCEGVKSKYNKSPKHHWHVWSVCLSRRLAK